MGKTVVEAGGGGREPLVFWDLEEDHGFRFLGHNGKIVEKVYRP